MTYEIIIRFSPEDIGAFGTIRTWPDLRVAVSGDEYWMRGLPHESLLLAKLPVKELYRMDEQQRLFGFMNKTPHGVLKKMSWEPLQSFLTVEPPVSGFPASTDEPLHVRLAPAAGTTSPVALMTSLSEWKTYADSAPLIRLQRLRFAVCETGEVLVLGTPLPSLPGHTYYSQEHLLLPSGYDFDPVVAAQFIIPRLATGSDTIVLFHADGQWEKIAGSSFISATRSAIRHTNI